MANICRTMKISMLIDIKLEEMSEKWEFRAEKGGKYLRQRNGCQVLEAPVRTLRK